MSDFKIVGAGGVENPYADSDVPGAFRSLTESLRAEQRAAGPIAARPPPGVEQAAGTSPEKMEEISRPPAGTRQMRFGDERQRAPAGWAVRVAPRTPRSH